MALRIAFMTSGAGGDFLACERAINAGILKGTLVGLLTTGTPSASTKRAAIENIPVYFVESGSKDRSSIDNEVGAWLKSFVWDLCFLAGYRYLIGEDLVNKYAGRIINSHPSILPANPGLFNKEMLFASDQKLLGASVHFVNDKMDDGKIIVQAAFPNLGMEAKDNLLVQYRKVQDVLAVAAVQYFDAQPVYDPVTIVDTILFHPPVSNSLTQLFF